MYNEQQDYYNMKIRGVGKLPVFTLENEFVIAIKDLSILGVYTYMKMLMGQGTIGLHEMISSICEQFSLKEKTVLEKIKVLDKLGLIMIGKDK